MTYYTYTFALPYEGNENFRRGYKLPREILLAPYLASNPFFVDYTNAIDVSFDLMEQQIDSLKNLRNTWVQNKYTEEKITAGEKLIAIEEWGGFDRQTTVNQVSQLGLNVKTENPEVNDLIYRAFYRFAGEYWLSKGTSKFIDFLNFCLGTNLTVKPCWTTDYINFLPEGDERIDLKNTIFNNPTGVNPWYPTTHVEIESTPEAIEVINSIENTLLALLNYNLVMLPINTRIDLNKGVGTPMLGALTFNKSIDFNYSQT